mmetsp:Transcript_7391/g.11012  ORF Transcript_7391/g.11012 Transcript_7391/m.11012 type:complete len:807 (+) Transcript_7391:53-2473(+)
MRKRIDAKCVFEDLCGGENVVSGSAVLVWIKNYEINKEELITAWDIADKEKKGFLTFDSWQIFLSELGIEDISTSKMKATNENLGSMTIAMCLVAVALNPNDDKFNFYFLERCQNILKQSANIDYTRLVGIGKDIARARLKPYISKNKLSSHQNIIALLIWHEACCRAVPYDARSRRAFRELAEAWGFNFAQLESRVLRAVLKRVKDDNDADSKTQTLTGSKENANSWTWGQYAKVGGASLAAGVVVAATAGVAAPFVAAALAGSTFWGAGAAAALASSTGVVALAFGSAGGGLAGYRMKRRVANLTDFEFIADCDKAPRGGTAVLIPGSLGHVHDCAAVMGLPVPKDTPLLYRLRRALAVQNTRYPQLVSQAEAIAFWRRCGCEDEKSDSDNESKLASALYDGDATRTVDAEPSIASDDLENDEEIATAIFKKLGSDTSTEDDAELSAEAVVIENLFFSVTNQNTNEDTRDEAEPPTPLEVVKASQLFKDALQEADLVKEEQVESETLSSTRLEKKAESNDPPLWWWRQIMGPALGLEAVGLVWERELLVEVSNSMDAMTASLATSGTQEAIIYGAAASTAAAILSSLVLPIALVRATKYIDSTWTIGVERADAAGIALADALCDTRARPITLIGYSLGARVIFSCLRELAKREKEIHSSTNCKESFCGIVEDAILLGAPIPASFGTVRNAADLDPWEDAASVVAGRLVNAYSNNDLVLALLYRSQSWATRIAGLHPLRRQSVRDFDITDYVQTHNDYPRLLPILLTHIFADLDPLDVVDCAPPSSYLESSIANNEDRVESVSGD